MNERANIGGRSARTSSAAAARRGDTRERLLAAARTCVRDKGVQGATSRDITARAGVNLAAITYHFGSKDELVATALFDELEARLGPALEILRSDGDPTAVMLGGVARLIDDFEAARSDAPVYFEALVMALRPGPFAATARKLVRSIQRLLRDQIGSELEQGIVPSWVDPDAMASLVIAVANGVALQTSIDRRGPSPRAIAAQFALLLASSGSGSGSGSGSASGSGSTDR